MKKRGDFPTGEPPFSHSINSVERIMKDLRKCKPLTPEEEHELWLDMKQGSKKAFDSLVRSNMPYAMSIAKKYMPSKARLEDLYQMLLDGYSTKDFARKHHLGEKQMTRLFNILREEVGLPLPQAA